MEKKVVYIFTAAYPYGRMECFLENELPVIAPRFEKIYLFPQTMGFEMRSVPGNVTVMNILNKRQGLASGNIFFSNFFFIFKTLLSEFIHCPTTLYFIKNIRFFNSTLIRGIYDSEIIAKLKEYPNGKIIFYSVWLNDWALALSVLKSKKRINNFIFRCGGFDIYDERHEGNYLPFRHFVYKNAFEIYPNSKMAEDYLKKKEMFPEKIKVEYLGTSDYGQNNLKADATFTIVSCSSVIPLKRVHLIVEILKHLSFEVLWVHFGDGELMTQLKKSAETNLPSNIKYDFRGTVSNSEVMKFYKSNPVNLFVTVSETEGLPISIQEAISFGIPVIATNVGGIPEIVNEYTGQLIEKDFDPEIVSKLISDFSRSAKNSNAFRMKVRDFWKNKFDAKRIYEAFSEKLLKIPAGNE